MSDTSLRDEALLDATKKANDYHKDCEANEEHECWELRSAYAEGVLAERRRPLTPEQRKEIGKILMDFHNGIYMSTQRGVDVIASCLGKEVDRG